MASPFFASPLLLVLSFVLCAYAASWHTIPCETGHATLHCGQMVTRSTRGGRAEFCPSQGSGVMISHNQIMTVMHVSGRCDKSSVMISKTAKHAKFNRTLDMPVNLTVLDGTFPDFPTDIRYSNGEVTEMMIYRWKWQNFNGMKTIHFKRPNSRRLYSNEDVDCHSGVATSMFKINELHADKSLKSEWLLTQRCRCRHGKFACPGIKISKSDKVKVEGFIVVQLWGRSTWVELEPLPVETQDKAMQRSLETVQSAASSQQTHPPLAMMLSFVTIICVNSQNMLSTSNMI